jgi:hypothetical protein
MYKVPYKLFLSNFSHLSAMSSTLATVGILSIGEMGLGVAKLLIAQKYRVVTNISGRRYLELRSFLLSCSQILLSSILSHSLHMTNASLAVQTLKHVPGMAKSKLCQVTQNLFRPLITSSPLCLHEMPW